MSCAQMRQGQELRLSDAPAVAAALDRFRNPLGRVSPAFDLDHIGAALAKLGDPQNSIPTPVHLTGTNGKGSTAAFLRAMAEAAGLKVHVFTSPHLVRVNERIRVAGRLVGDDALADALERVHAAGPDLTYFEALTAAAYLLFRETRADLSIIEVGAGGLLDATNVMARPAATCVTPISLDHESMFGVSGVAAIARLKAGIFRTGVPAVLSVQSPLALGVLREEARKLSAPVWASERDWRTDWDDEAFVYMGPGLNVRSPWLGLPGRHQAENAGAACAIVEALGAKAPAVLRDPEIMAAGLREAVWPGRLQRLQPGPLAPDDRAVYIDAAHNPGGAAVLAGAIRAARPELGRDRASVVIAMQETKDAAGVFGELGSAVDDVFTCPLPPSGGQEGGAGADPLKLADVARRLGVHAMPANDVGDAIRLAVAGGAQRIYVCGSVYLCGAALHGNGEQVA